MSRHCPFSLHAVFGLLLCSLSPSPGSSSFYMAVFSSVLLPLSPFSYSNITYGVCLFLVLLSSLRYSFCHNSMVQCNLAEICDHMLHEVKKTFSNNSERSTERHHQDGRKRGLTQRNQTARGRTVQTWSRLALLSSFHRLLLLSASYSPSPALPLSLSAISHTPYFITTVRRGPLLIHIFCFGSHPSSLCYIIAPAKSHTHTRAVLSCYYQRSSEVLFIDSRFRALLKLSQNASRLFPSCHPAAHPLRFNTFCYFLLSGPQPVHACALSAVSLLTLIQRELPSFACMAFQLQHRGRPFLLALLPHLISLIGTLLLSSHSCSVSQARASAPERTTMETCIPGSRGDHVPISQTLLISFQCRISLIHERNGGSAATEQELGNVMALHVDLLAVCGCLLTWRLVTTFLSLGSLLLR